ncbi:MAG: SPFH domain-containing protein [Candidatus Micrarchaeia archaeon]
METDTSTNEGQEAQGDEVGVASQQAAQVSQPPEAQAMKKYYGRAGALADLIIIIAIGAAGIYEIGVLAGSVLALIVLIIVLSLSIRVVSQWNRMAVLRFGKYKGMIGPGIYFIIPLVEHTPFNVDLRVISTPFSAEKTLTKDNVPVDVDAILFWQVKNPENAVLNVQNYMQSVQLASQTAMRDIIGKNELSLMLAGRDIIGEDIRKLIQERIENWGIVAISVEIRDVTIPPELQSAMARVATSDREKQARVILAESESLAADKMLEAAEKYRKDLYAMQLRSLNMMYEISLSGKNLIVFVPTEAKGFSIPTPFGVMGLQDYYKQQTTSTGPAQQGPKGKKAKS